MSDPYKLDKAFGRELGKALKMVAWVLHDWSRQHADHVMSAIAFDKLIVVVCRYWNALEQAGIVAFRTPFRKEQFGIHGDGMALRQNPTAVPVPGDAPSNHPFLYGGRVVELFNGLLPGEFQLVKINDPNGKREFATGLTGAQIGFWEGDRRFLSHEELGVFSVLRSSLAGLSQEEIRLLGTHTSAKANDGILRRIWDIWTDRFLNALEKPMDPVVDLRTRTHKMRSAVVAARELLRKSAKNKLTYAAARQKLFKNIEGTPLERIVSHIQSSHESIWGASSVETWRKGSRLAFRLSKYAYASMLRAREITGDILNKEEKREIEDGRRCRTKLNGNLPASTVQGLPFICTPGMPVNLTHRRCGVCHK